MVLIWTPDPALPLIDVSVLEAPVTATVQAAPDAEAPEPVTVGGLSWAVDPPLPAGVGVTVAGDTLTVHAEDWAGAFPMSLDYLREGVPGTATRWGDLPAEAEEVIAFRPSPSSVRVYALAVTAQTVTAEGGDGGTETAIYTLRLTADYTDGRDSLREAVHARR